MTSDQVLQVERHEHVEVLRFHRPERMNALNGRLLLDLTAAVKRTRDDRTVDAFIITGSPRPDGRPCFSAGDDLKEAASGGAPPGNPGSALTNLIDDVLTPSIAVIDGVCTTGALEIALACDLRIVADSAQISDWHLARLGSGLGGWGASTRLARLIGCRPGQGPHPHGQGDRRRRGSPIGLAQHVVPSTELWDHAMQMARRIAEMDPNGVRMTMAHLARVQNLSKEESLAFAKQMREWFAPLRSLSQATSGVLDARRGSGGSTA